ncbi:SMI1/KNR4 family protein [Actinomadura craniellae]|uniref:SMI1/KNR4 family protein n=1 Tax=Actinomadura craniellae TaxID=2231787 RepID=A0A365GYP7_9ACTN|nr:SMI1/KNR4 family protein [Actinomadura craniellae]RAY11053.1 SMI1/KNR4 family protein [Actinomadura craniellae]
MAQKFDLVQEVSAGVEDRAAAWRFVRGFARDWASPLTDGDGWSEEDLAAAEERLGVRLPVALREAYLLLGRREDLTSNHDTLLSPAELYLDDRKEALVFRQENQGAASWGVLVADLGEADPAVFVRMDLADKRSEIWERWLDRLSLTFIEIVLSESVQAPGELTDFLGELEEEDLETLERDCTRLPFPEYPLCQQPPGTRWFTGPGVLLREDDRAVLYARGRTPEALDEVRDQIAGDWLNDYR